MKLKPFATYLLVALMALAALPCLAQGTPDNAVNEKLVRDYYAAYVTKDWSIMDRILSDDFHFTSPAGDDHIDLKEYKHRCWPNSANTKTFELEQLMVSGNSALATYNGHTNDGRTFRNTELFIFKDGKIVSNECFFGTGVNFPNSGKK